MSHHDRLCPTNQNDDPNCWFCEHNANVRAEERNDIEESFKRGGGNAWQANLYSMAYERGCADERANFAQRLMLAGIEQSAADVRRQALTDLRTKVEALPTTTFTTGRGEWDGEPVVRYADVIALFPETYQGEESK